MKSRLLLSCMLVSAAGSVFAHDDEIAISSGSELRDWCRAESEAYFVGHGQTPFNWTASHVEDGNTLRVHGKWRVDSREISVECSVPKGGQRKYAKMEIDG